MTNPNSSVVILTYNSAATIEACLSSVLRVASLDAEVIVVDNASADETVAVVKQFGDRVQLIPNQDNFGFSKGANVGLRQARSEFVLLLNPDTIVYEGCFESLQARFADTLVAAVGPVSNYVAGMQNVGHHLDVRSGVAHEHLHLMLSDKMRGRSLHTRLLIGFCVMFRTSVLDEVGYLDEDLFLGSDDLELSWRLRLNGYKLLIAPDVYVEHKGGVSFASEPEERVRRLLDESTAVLREKLRQFYSPAPVPSSRVLWGCDIFPG